MRQGNSSRRSRGRGNGKRQPRSNQIDSHGPEVRVRGTAQQVFDKYLALARDATSSGDRIAAENMFQHAEHYSRVLTIAQENSENRSDNRDGGKNRHDRASKDQIGFETNEDRTQSNTAKGSEETDFDTTVVEENVSRTDSSGNEEAKKVEPESESSDTSSELNNAAKQATL